MENPIRLLVADDSLTIQKVIRLALASEPYEIVTVSNGNECLEQLRSIKPNVLLIDVSLPGKTAFEIKRELAAEPRLADTQCVLMSSAFKPVDENQVVELGFTHRLIKPFDPGDLRRMLTELTTPAQKFAVSETVSASTPITQFAEADFDFRSSTPQQDTQRLTEMTFENSQPPQALDQEWTIQESGSDTFAELPPLTPLEPMVDTIPMEPAAAPVETDSIWESHRGRSRTDTFVEMQEFAPPPALEFNDRPVSNESGGMHFTPAQLELLIQEQVQDQIKRQVQIELERMTVQMLPTLAEKLIRDEIHKMLMNPPERS